MSRINLSELSTKAPAGLDKNLIKEQTKEILKDLNELQNLLYAENKNSMLVVLQGMDGSGKDGVIRNVMGSMNPQGVTVKSYKAPSSEELSHDFLWRIHSHTPAKGMIQVFNRSHYEDILITRVHKWCDDEMAKKRIQAINDFEKLLKDHNNTQVLKFYLHISPEEQKQRLDERMSDQRKMWKFNANDFEEAKLKEQYLVMYEDCFANCNEPEWIIVPADQNWYKEYLIATKIRDVLTSLKMEYPKMQ